MHLIGKPLREALDQDGRYFKFGKWIFETYITRFEDIILDSEENENYGSFKDRVVEKILETTKPGEAVLLSVSEGAHWFNAYNDGERIWFIDSQKGKWFNLDGLGVVSLDMDIDCDTSISIIHVTAHEISDYEKTF